MEVNGTQYEGVLFANNPTSGSDHPQKLSSNLNTTANSQTSSIDERPTAPIRPLISG